MAGDGGRAKFMDDLAGMAGGAFSVLAGLRAEAEQMAKSQAEAMVRRFDLATCRDLAARAVACSTPQEVRALVPMDEN